MRKLCILLLALSAGSATAQNLVLNPDFEETANCAYYLGQFANECTHWSTPTQGTTDLHNACAPESEVGVPRNTFGKQEAFSGKNYAGFYARQRAYREYAQGRLSEPLKAGERYRVTFYLSLALISEYAVKDLGMIFTPEKVWTAHNLLLDDSTLKKYGHGDATHIELHGTPFFDKNHWTKVETTFMAKGGETFFCIGNFNSEAKTVYTPVMQGKQEIVYYYLDKVSVEPLWQENPGSANAPAEITATPIPSYADDQPYILQHVLFDFDSIVIDGPARDELLSLSLFLSENPTKTILIEGHTDNIGSEAYNLDISHKRASAVADFLIVAGLDPDRITTTGLGYVQPIATNDTEEGRAKNRRVAFIISDTEKE